MTYINNYESFNVSGTVTVEDAYTVKNSNGDTTAVQLYTLAAIYQANSNNRIAIADQLNLIQAKSEEAKTAAALSAALGALTPTDTGVYDDAAIRAAVKSVLPTLSYDEQRAYYTKVTGYVMGVGDFYDRTASQFDDIKSKTSLYVQNLSSDSSVAQNKLTALTNNQQALFDAMTALLKGLSDLRAQLVRAI